MPEERLHFVTDTATLCVFDVASLKHRLESEGDWWAMPDEALREVRNGSAVFVNLGADGRYDVAVGSEVLDGITAVLNCPSGLVFVGAAEEVTGDGLEPKC